MSLIPQPPLEGFDSRKPSTFAEKSHQLQRLLRNAGYIKADGVSTAGIRLVSRVAKREKLRDWPHTRTIGDYDALIAAVSAELHAMRAKARKPLNQREAAAIVAAHIGPRGGVRILRTLTAPNIGEPTQIKTKTFRQIIELRHVGDLVIRGEHPTSWRKAFEAAGIFDV